MWRHEELRQAAAGLRLKLGLAIVWLCLAICLCCVPLVIWHWLYALWFLCSPGVHGDYIIGGMPGSK